MPARPLPAAARRRFSRAGGACLVGVLLSGAAGCGGAEVTAGPAASAAVSDSATPGAPTPLPTSSSPASTSPAGPTTDVDAAPTSGPGSRPTPSSTTTAALSGPAEADEDALDVPEGAGTAPSEQAAGGGPLSVVAVRSARHDGFDRVVLELAGEEPGEPGWYARYVDEPTQEASGAPLDVEGDAFLELSVRGTGYPFDTGQDELLGTVPGQGTDLVREVLVGGVFEGQAQVVVGLSEEVPYVVTRLQDPPRVVLDLVG
ncbi:hypothetical protein WDZ17_11975 [Pseudokineococcus basanitobsidens]|uniref:AMIN-like domain-containing protein n=1 Tax=Pseudokineococcus basanitobsidens TaxID=1926649 RepID=A0ABU8RM04_9ACTN